MKDEFIGKTHTNMRGKSVVSQGRVQLKGLRKGTQKSHRAETSAASLMLPQEGPEALVAGFAPPHPPKTCSSEDNALGAGIFDTLESGMLEFKA